MLEKDDDNNTVSFEETCSNMLIETSSQYDYDDLQDINLHTTNNESSPTRSSSAKRPSCYKSVDTYESTLFKKRAVLKCENYRNILVGFYKVHMPNKMDNIKFLLKKFHNDEKKLRQLIQKVEKTYNVILLPLPGYYQQINNNDNNDDSNSPSPKKEEEQEEAKNRKSIHLIPPPITTAQTSPSLPARFSEAQDKYQAELTTFYDNIDHKNTTTTASSPPPPPVATMISPVTSPTGGAASRRKSIMNSYKKKKNKIRKFFSKLGKVHKSVQTYIEDESLEFSESLLSENSKNSVYNSNDYDIFRECLQEFYLVHNPDKVQNVDLLLDLFKGKEDELMKRIEETYNYSNDITNGENNNDNDENEKEEGDDTDEEMLEREKQALLLIGDILPTATPTAGLAQVHFI